MPRIIPAFVSLVVFASAAPAADWPQFLGPDRSGAADESEKALPEKFPAELETLWSQKLGSGFSGPVIADGTAVLFHRDGDEVVVEALDAASGKKIWIFKAPTAYRDSMGMSDGPRGTPAIADGRVFAHGADGMVYAVDFKTGKLLWSLDTEAEMKSPQGFFGRACSPLVVGGKVIVTPGGSFKGKPAGVIALDAATGKLLWQSVADEAGYSSPIAYGDPEKPRLLCWMRNELWALESATGKVRRHRRLRSGMDASVNTATPIAISEGDYYISAGYGVGASVWGLEPDEEPFEPGDLGHDLIESHYSTPVFSDYHLYGFHDRQETGQTLRCIDLNEGKLRWESQKLPGGHVILVGDKLVVVTEQGELWIVKASPEKFQQLHVSQILRSGHRSPPAFADGVLYARDGEKLVAVRIK